MDIFTVSFFGHREIARASEVEQRLEELLRELIRRKEYVEFLIGRDGAFDLLASSEIRRAVRRALVAETPVLRLFCRIREPSIGRTKRIILTITMRLKSARIERCNMPKSRGAASSISQRRCKLLHAMRSEKNTPYAGGVRL